MNRKLHQLGTHDWFVKSDSIKNLFVRVEKKNQSNLALNKFFFPSRFKIILEMFR